MNSVVLGHSKFQSCSCRSSPRVGMVYAFITTLMNQGYDKSELLWYFTERTLAIQKLLLLYVATYSMISDSFHLRPPAEVVAIALSVT